MPRIYTFLPVKHKQYDSYGAGACVLDGPFFTLSAYAVKEMKYLRQNGLYQLIDDSVNKNNSNINISDETMTYYYILKGIECVLNNDDLRNIFAHWQGIILQSHVKTNIQAYYIISHFHMEIFKFIGFNYNLKINFQQKIQEIAELNINTIQDLVNYYNENNGREHPLLF